MDPLKNGSRDTLLSHSSLDTMNTAARIEDTGESGRIHISQTTAELLTGVGKKHWLVPRDEAVHAKGTSRQHVAKQFDLS